MLVPAVHRGRNTTRKTLKTICNALAWPRQCWKSCAIGFNTVALRFGNHSLPRSRFWMSRNAPSKETFGGALRDIQKTAARETTTMTEQKKCWELLAQKFDRFQTFPNNSQQHATCNIQNVGRCWPTM